jgi:hypothetical protein
VSKLKIIKNGPVTKFRIVNKKWHVAKNTRNCTKKEAMRLKVCRRYITNFSYQKDAGKNANVLVPVLLCKHRGNAKSSAK